MFIQMCLTGLYKWLPWGSSYSGSGYSQLMLVDSAAFPFLRNKNKGTQFLKI
jgi:hypothetical protein